jgi:hypothetical protein
MTKKRSYTVDLFEVQCGPENERVALAVVLAALPQKSPVEVSVHGRSYEMREFTKSHGNYTGWIAKLRMDDLPHAGALGGKERELDLKAEEGLLEKTHFMLIPSHEVLLLQRNRVAGGLKALTELLSNQSGATVVAHPIIQAEAIERLLDGNASLRRVEVEVARPKNPDLLKAESVSGWTKHVLETLAETGGYKVRLQIKADARTDTPLLHRDLLKSLKSLRKAVDVTHARATVVEAGDEEPIGTVDLLQDRLAGTAEVDVVDRYPNSIGMWKELARIWHSHKPLVEKVLGKPSKKLD